MLTEDLVQPFPRLSDHFGGRELTANGRGFVVERIPVGIAQRMEAQARDQMERVRSDCADGAPITVTRWYAPPELNELQGGVSESQHTMGEAIDWYTKNVPVRLVFARLVKSDIVYDQAIYYPKRGFVHTSYRSGSRAPGNRRQTLFCPFTKAEATARKRAKKKVYFDYNLYATWEKDPTSFAKEH